MVYKIKEKLTAIFLKVTINTFPYATDYYSLLLISKSYQQCSHDEVSINALHFVSTVWERGSHQHIAHSKAVFNASSVPC